jgi:hypothetical protein
MKNEEKSEGFHGSSFARFADRLSDETGLTEFTGFRNLLHVSSHSVNPVNSVYPPPELSQPQLPPLFASVSFEIADCLAQRRGIFRRYPWPMQLHKPSWRSKQTCPCCEEGGLAFSTCPDCEYTVLICEEVGTVYPARMPLSSEPIGDLEDGVLCPGCHRVPITRFRDSTTVQIHQLGFQPGQYV